MSSIKTVFDVSLGRMEFATTGIGFVGLLATQEDIAEHKRENENTKADSRPLTHMASPQYNGAWCGYPFREWCTFQRIPAKICRRVAEQTEMVFGGVE